MSIKNSCIYQGRVRHRRFLPKRHELNYSLYMMFIDLDEWPEIFRGKWYASLERFNLLSLRRNDYFQGNKSDLKQSIVDYVENDFAERGLQYQTITRVMLLTHGRHFNVIFNPVSFYYCYDDQDQLVAILSQITNTPWGERHSYVLPKGQSDAVMQVEQKGRDKHVFKFDKRFHVSPFNPMNMDYRWVFSEPSEKLHVHMDNFLQDADNEKHFDATLTMERRSWQALPKSLIQTPLITVKVMWGIYWHALRLWMKVPFYDHPKTKTATPQGADNKTQ